MSVARFDDGQRVFVLRDHQGTPIRTWGSVCRLRRADYGAWINLDQRHDACPFPADDTRSRHIMAYPEDCSSFELQVAEP